MTAPDHGSRDHATWSASASARLWACPGSLALSAGAGPDKESHAAAWGTACHQVAERCLSTGEDPAAFIGGVEVTKEHTIDVDDEVAETADVYVDYVRREMDAYEAATGEKAVLMIEQRFSLSAIDPPFEAGGTGDAVILYPYFGEIEIVDLKGGRGIVVEALGNKQLRTYALGALLANPGRWRKVTATVVQPRAPHPDGRIRSETIDVVDLMDWTVELLDAMGAADEAAALQEAYTLDAWANIYLAPGDHCTFCRAKVTCPALGKAALAAAQTFFDDQTATIATPPDPQSLPIDKVVAVLDAADMITGWLNAVRAHAQRLAEGGAPIEANGVSYVLTPKRAVRKWREDAEEAISFLAESGFTGGFYNEPKLKTPAQMEKALGKKGYEAVKHLVVQESSGLNLVRADKTTRGAVPAPVHQMFQPITES